MSDLQNVNQWRLILRSSYQVQHQSPTKYTAIPDFFVEFSKPVVVAGGVSETAKAHWFLGAYITQYLDISPSESNRLRNFVKVGERQKIPLDQMAKLEFQDYGIYPYHAKVEIPYWIEDISLEIWEFHGQELIKPSLEYLGGLLLETRTNIETIDLDLDRIEEKLDTNYGQ